MIGHRDCCESCDSLNRDLFCGDTAVVLRRVFIARRESWKMNCELESFYGAKTSSDFSPASLNSPSSPTCSNLCSISFSTISSLCRLLFSSVVLDSASHHAKYGGAPCHTRRLDHRGPDTLYVLDFGQIGPHAYQ